MSEGWQAFADRATRADKFAPLGLDAVSQILAHATTSLSNVDASKSGEIRAQCPFHVSDNGGFSQTLRINTSPHSKYGIGFFKCYSCSKKGHWNVLAEHLGIDSITAEPNPELSNILVPLHQEREVKGFDARKLSALPNTFSWKRSDEITISQVALSIVESKLWYRNYVPVPKLGPNGKPVTLPNGRFEIDYFTEELRLWMPVVDDNVVVAHVAALIGERHWWSKKYLNAKGDWPKKFIWPLDQILRKMRDRSVLAICEGPADALRLIDNGIPAIANLGVAAWTKSKADVIAAHYNRVALCFDADDAGAKAQAEVLETFKGLIPASAIKLPPKQDPASLPQPMLNKLISIIRR
jgi:5S rRNA maturation endonuclease (ribonuclease M5)